MASKERICEFETAIQNLKGNVVDFAEPKKEETLIKRKNCNYFYCFGSTKRSRGIPE